MLVQESVLVVSGKLTRGPPGPAGGALVIWVKYIVHTCPLPFANFLDVKTRVLMQVLESVLVVHKWQIDKRPSAASWRGFGLSGQGRGKGEYYQLLLLQWNKYNDKSINTNSFTISFQQPCPHDYHYRCLPLVNSNGWLGSTIEQL